MYEKILADYIRDVWSEIEASQKSSKNSATEKALMRMELLGIFQSKADAFGIDRSDIGLPLEDADVTFIKQQGADRE
jgi:hypothetical protein